MSFEGMLCGRLALHFHNGSLATPFPSTIHTIISSMTPNNFREKANFIWQVADDTLRVRGTFKAHEYGDVILPFVVLRRRIRSDDTQREAGIKRLVWI
jgi:hypothetical protein